MPDDPFTVTRGQLTFDAEGQESGPYHSRVLHVPSTSSGLTLGRGYDMKERTRSTVRDDLVVAGVPADMAALISQAAGRFGAAAEEFIAENDLEGFEVPPGAQKPCSGKFMPKWKRMRGAFRPRPMSRRSMARPTGTGSIR